MDTRGQGKNEDISEAEAIKRELIKNNISAERIIVEDKSKIQWKILNMPLVK